MSGMPAVSNPAGCDRVTDTGACALLECQRWDEADGQAVCPSSGAKLDCETGKNNRRGKGWSAENGGMMIGREGAGDATRGDCR